MAPLKVLLDVTEGMYCFNGVSLYHVICRRLTALFGQNGVDFSGLKVFFLLFLMVS